MMLGVFGLGLLIAVGGHGHEEPVFGDRGRSVVTLIPLAPVTRREINLASSALIREFAVSVKVGPRTAMPKSAWVKARRRWRADRILPVLAGKASGHVMGITRADISTSAHGYRDWGIMGLANLGGPAAVVSSFRARTAIKFELTVIHEYGHVLGLPHCRDLGCLMADYTESKKSGNKASGRFCAACRAALGGRLRHP